MDDLNIRNSTFLTESALPFLKTPASLEPQNIEPYRYTQFFQIFTDILGDKYIIRLRNQDDNAFVQPTIQKSVGNKWSDPVNLPGVPGGMMFTGVAVAFLQDNKVLVTLIGFNDGLPYSVWRAADHDTWSWYGQLPIGDYKGAGFDWITCAEGNSGNMQVILLDKKAGNPCLIWRASGNGSWAWDENFQENFSNYSFRVAQLGVGNEGNLQLISIQRDTGKPFLIWQAAGNGVWASYGELPFSGDVEFESVQIGYGNGNDIEAVFLGTDGLPYLIWQAAGNGIWTWYGPLPTGARRPGHNQRKFSAFIFVLSDARLTIVLLEEQTDNLYAIRLRRDNIWEWLGPWRP
jgi:hypothetical protein